MLRYIALLLAVIGLAGIAGYFFDLTKASTSSTTADASPETCDSETKTVAENGTPSEREALFVSCGGFLE